MLIVSLYEKNLYFYVVVSWVDRSIRKLSSWKIKLSCLCDFRIWCWEVSSGFVTIKDFCGLVIDEVD